MGVEYELKFRATPEIQVAICDDIQGEEALYQMHTTYYDTPTGALSCKKYILRRRMENDICVCTIKTPIQGHGRGEWETQCQDILQAIPVLVSLGAPQELIELTWEGLEEVCGAKFTRIAKTLVLEDGVLELALDKGVLTGGGKEIPLCEVEVELKEGTPEFAEFYGKYMARKYGLIPEPGSKFRRALALSKGEK